MLTLVYMKKPNKNNPTKVVKKNHSALSDGYASIDVLMKKIDELKRTLRQLVKERGISDKAVLQVSQELDKYIVQAQRIMRESR